MCCNKSNNTQTGNQQQCKVNDYNDVKGTINNNIMKVKRHKITLMAMGSHPASIEETGKKQLFE